jgi:hypothetical protein
VVRRLVSAAEGLGQRTWPAAREAFELHFFDQVRLTSIEAWGKLLAREYVMGKSETVVAYVRRFRDLFCP